MMVRGGNIWEMEKAEHIKGRMEWGKKTEAQQ